MNDTKTYGRAFTSEYYDTLQHNKPVHLMGETH